MLYNGKNFAVVEMAKVCLGRFPNTCYLSNGMTPSPLTIVEIAKVCFFRFPDIWLSQQWYDPSLPISRRLYKEALQQKVRSFFFHVHEIIGTGEWHKLS